MGRHKSRSIDDQCATLTIQEKYDLTADLYDSLYLDEQLAKLDTLSWFGLSFHGMVLDIGCGTGISMRWKGKIVSIGIDLSLRMLNIASKKGYEVVQGDMCHLPFREEAFQSATLITSLHHATDVKVAINEAYRTMVNGGYLVLSLLKATDWIEDARYAVFHDGFQIQGTADGSKDYLLIMKKGNLFF